MKILAIIPARSGSKGVPKKNTFIINNKPLIQYTIEAALESKLINKIIVSSDGLDILDIARKFENVFIHHRDDLLATDSSPIIDTIFDILKKNLSFDAVMLLQPTAPIRTGKQIDDAIKLFVNSKANSLVSVVAMDDIHPARMYWKKNNILKSIMPEFEAVRRQDIPKAYYRNGSIYLTRIDVLINEKKILVPPVTGYEMPINQLLNIDEPRDIIIAETLIKAWKEGII